MFRLTRADLDRSEATLRRHIASHPSAQGYAWMAFLKYPGFLNILTACEYVGLFYKARIGRDHPTIVEPRLRPCLRLLLAVPAHESYPSNHAFQCFSIAFAFNAILPEHPATDDLARLAQNVAENREWAGLHYPSDTEAGKELARQFAPYLRDALGATFLAAQGEWH